MLASKVDRHALALDVACGGDQASLGMAMHFDHVVASDASILQLERAQMHKNVRYIAALAAQPPLKSHSVDIITVATGASLV